MSQPLQREMTITHADFFRLLPKAINGHRHRIESGQVEVAVGAGKVRILLEKESVRQLASLQLPLTVITISTENLSLAEEARFLTRFDLAFQKGGG